MQRFDFRAPIFRGQSRTCIRGLRDGLEDKGRAGQYIKGVLKQLENSGIRQFATIRVDRASAGELDKHEVTYFGEAPSTWLPDVLFWILSTLLFFGAWMFVVRRFAQRGGMMVIGKSRAKIYVEKDTKITFADVAGVDEAKEELKEIVDFLRDPKASGETGAT